MSNVYDLTGLEEMRRERENRSVKCDCGRKHWLASSDSACECGQLYNAFGQRLKPANQWGENGDY